jgi:(p)ppGpp synthase/HD superfamily hydrolase
VNRFEALRQAVEAHAGKKDKCGRDYVLHPIAVADALDHAHHGEYAIVAALLHDVWEDTPFRLKGLDELQAEHLDILTKRPTETYAEYIERCLGDFTTAHVKLADLWHNLQPERQACLPAKEQASLEKRYLKARDRIWEALGYEWWPDPLQAEEGSG